MRKTIEEILDACENELPYKHLISKEEMADIRQAIKHACIEYAKSLIPLPLDNAFSAHYKNGHAFCRVDMEKKIKCDLLLSNTKQS